MELKTDEVTDSLLIGDYQIIQNTKLYKFTSDSVLLSRFATPKANDVVADFCAGSGIVGLHFYALHERLIREVVFFEMQPALQEMNARTIALNGLQEKFTSVCCKVQEIPSKYVGKFSLILCNPPYEVGGFENADPQKAMCRKEIFLSLSELCASAARNLKYGGRICLCHRADRAAELCYTLHDNGIEPKRMQFVCGKAGDTPYLVMIEGKKGGKPGVKILPTAVNTSKETASEENKK